MTKKLPHIPTSTQMVNYKINNLGAAAIADVLQNCCCSQRCSIFFFFFRFHWKIIVPGIM